MSVSMSVVDEMLVQRTGCEKQETGLKLQPRRDQQWERKKKSPETS